MANAQLGIFNLPEVDNEPTLNYAPGSFEREALQAALKEMEQQMPFEVPCIVNGKVIKSDEPQLSQPIPHSHAQTLCTYNQASPETTKLAIAGALAAKTAWESLPWSDRAAVFLKAAELLSSTAPGSWRYKLMAATMLGQGKNIWQAEIDSVAELVDFWRFGVKFVDELYRVQPGKNAKGVWNRSEYRPLEGFVLAISPFNFTAIGGNLPGVPALVGNTVVWKPSPAAIYSNYLIHSLLTTAGLPPGVIQFLPGDAPTIASLALAHRDLAAIHFTGSSAVFRGIWKEVGLGVGEGRYRGFPRIVGETGGKNWHLVEKSVKDVPGGVQYAVVQSVRAAFEYQGQKCSALSRLYVSKSVWEEGGFKDLLVQEVNKIKVGSPTEVENFMGPVIHQQSYDKILSYITNAKQSPETNTILAGGTGDASKGWFVNPTIILTTDPKSPSMVEEIFGPVLTVYVYEDDKYEDVLSLIDDTSDYALTGAIFAPSRTTLLHASSRLRNAAGNVYYNDKCTGAVVGQQPFGGARASGTNDKSGSGNVFWRFVSVRSVKDSLGGLGAGVDSQGKTAGLEVEYLSNKV